MVPAYTPYKALCIVQLGSDVTSGVLNALQGRR